MQGLLGKGQPRILILLRSKFGITSSCGSFENTDDQRGAWVGVFLQIGGRGEKRPETSVSSSPPSRDRGLAEGVGTKDAQDQIQISGA